jgi:hypothetical protein
MANFDAIHIDPTNIEEEEPTARCRLPFGDNKESQVEDKKRRADSTTQIQYFTPQIQYFTPQQTVVGCGATHAADVHLRQQ